MGQPDQKTPLPHESKCKTIPCHVTAGPAPPGVGLVLGDFQGLQRGQIEHRPPVRRAGRTASAACSSASAYEHGLGQRWRGLELFRRSYAIFFKFLS